MRTQKTKCQTQQSDMRADFGASLVCTGPYLLMWGTGMDLGKSHQPVYCTCVECWVGLGWVCVCVWCFKGRSVDTRASIARRPSRRVPRVWYHFPSFSPSQFTPQGPVGGYAWNQSCDVLRPVPERAMLLLLVCAHPPRR